MQRSAREAEVTKFVGELVARQLDEQLAAVAAAKQAVTDATERRDALASELRDFEGNKDERMAQAKAAIATADKEAKGAAKTLQAQRAKAQELSLQLEDMEKEVAATAAQLDTLATRQADQAEALALITKGRSRFGTSLFETHQRYYDERVRRRKRAKVSGSSWELRARV